MLIDSGTAMNSDNKAYHRAIMSQFSDIVAGYIECGPGTKYDLVQLKIAVTQFAVEVDLLMAHFLQSFCIKPPIMLIHNNLSFILL